MKLVAQTQLQIMSFSIISIQMKMMYNSLFSSFCTPLPFGEGWWERLQIKLIPYGELEGFVLGV